MPGSRRLVVSLVLGGLVLGAILIVNVGSRAAQESPQDEQRQRGLGAFETVTRVLRHPRCLNCHPSGDRPRVGEERVLHAMNVQRGPDGHGMAGLHCTACHRDANQDLAGVPGAPHWHLAPRSMGWEGLDDHELAEALKDRSKNGDRSFADLLEHMEKDPLVGWGWEPGVGRSKPHVSREVFVEAVRTWIDAGAPSPAPGVTTH